MKYKTKLLARDAFFSTIFSIILISLLALFVFKISFFNPVKRALKDYNYLDVFYAEKFHDTTKTNANIVLVNIQNNSRLEIGHMLDAIIKENPKTIGIDIIFKDKKENIYADSILASLLDNNNIITASVIEDNGMINNHSHFGENENNGFVNFNFDKGTSVIREFNGVKNIFGKERLSFASQIAKHYLNDEWQTFGYDNKLKIKHTIKFIGYYDAFQFLDIEDFLNPERLRFLKDKIVILGYFGMPTGSKTDIQDKFFTPLNAINVGKSDADMFGTTIHANIVNMLITNDFMYKVSNFWLGLFSFIAMFFSTMFYIKSNKIYKVSNRTRNRIFKLVLSTLILWISFWLFKHNIVFKPAIIIAAIVLSGSYLKYYKHLALYIKTKTNGKWKTYLK